MIISSIMQSLFDGICWFIESDEGLLSCWGLRAFTCVGISQVAYFCKFVESGKGNLVQK